MSRFRFHGRRQAVSLLAAGASSLALIVGAGSLGADLAGRTVHAGGFAAVHADATPTALPPAPGGYADVVARVSPSIVTIRSERTVKPASLPFRAESCPRSCASSGSSRPTPGRTARAASAPASS